ncbi:DUF6603 domain-containing protein [Halorubrum vacuolatum]|uniref:DUF6603 domain-containing protein n=1 Tax=Halorubrum vacuolatum TaxID=63740 RepID=A0A238UPK1_HALVU|nr:DUF6603 domain-containing protein [Halorubrum vacuolatum]SNR23577.1 hypothetical protein SAMN06264855_101142 [Halorubrum vacuolatum]
MGATQTTAEPVDEWIEDQLQDMTDVPADTLPEFLGNVAIDDADVSDDVASATLVIDGYPSLSVPGSAGVEFFLGEPEVSTAEIDVSLVLETEWALAIEGIELTARVDNGVLRPAPADDGTRADHVEFTTEVDITLDHTWEFGIEGFEGVDMTPAEIAKTGILIEASDIVLDVSPTELSPAIADHDEFDDAYVDEGFVGLFIGDASVSFPESWPLPAELTLQGATIGSGGFSGVIAYEPADLTFDDTTNEYTGEAAATLGDFSFGIDAVQVEFVQTALSTCSVSGELFLPYVDQRVAVDLGFDMEGRLAVELTDLIDADEPTDGPSGDLVTIEVAEAFALDVDGFGIVVSAETFALSVSGTVRPLFDAVDLPDVEVDDLTINDDGTVDYDDSWIDVPDQGATELEGIELEVSKFAVGTRDDGWRYLAFSGAISIVEGIPAGASADGLRVAWDPSGENDPTVSFDGIGIEFTIPDTLAFKGTVAYDGENGKYYGDIDLDLIALDTSISATLIVGEEKDASGQWFTYLGVSIDASLPVGIPLFSTGLSIYGMGALYAHNMEPDRGDKEWYALSGEKEESWYHAGNEPGVDDLNNQWAAKRGGFGFGAGVNIGTSSDNGFALTSDLLLVIAFPGPVIMLEGRADLLSPGEEIDSEGSLRTLAVLDGDAGDLTFGIDAQYTKASENTTLIDIRAGVEAYYDFTDPSAWYLNLGRRDPEDDRVRAELLVFSADGYFMLNADRVATGARVGYGEDFSFGPLAVDFEAFIEGHVLVSWQPTHFSGAVELYGAIELSAFGIGASITASAALAAEAIDPFHVHGEVSVELGTPWPLPDPEATVSLEWGPTPEPPEVPAPLSGVALGHERVTTRWPLPRAGQVDEVGDGAYTEALLEPDYATADAGGERLLGYDGDLPSPPEDDDKGPADPPRVPPDVRPELTFTTGVVDDGDVGVNASTSDAWTVIGDPEDGGPVEARYLLQDVSLQRWSESEDSYVDEGPVYGSWAPLPDTRIGAGGAPSDDGTPPVANTKLRLWSVNPYDYGRDTGGAWEEGIDRLLGSYPCYGDGRCFPLAGTAIGEELTRELEGEEFDGERITHEDDGWPQFLREVDELDAPPEVSPAETEAGFIEALRYLGPNRKHDPEDLTEVVVGLDGYRRSVELTLVVSRGNTRLSATALGYEGERKGSTPIDTRDIRSAPEFLTGSVEEEAFREVEVDPPTSAPFERRTVTFTADGGISHVLIRSTGAFGIVEVCEATVPIDALGADGVEGPAHVRDELVRWSEEPTVLEPNERYRLVIDTVAEARGIDGEPLSEFEHRWPDGDGTMTEMAYFETTGPPALADVSPPFGADDQEEGGSDAFGTLERYVESTVPESVVADGERPSVPRPVYRGYDVGVRFAEAYVESLYAMARRDLRLQLYDEDDRPVRDVDGRLGTARNPWAKAGTHALERHDRTWLSRVAEACGGIEEETLPYEDVLADDDPRCVLDPDTTYEARLVPALIREPFDTDGDRWSGGDGEAMVTHVGHDGASGESASVVSEDTDADEAVVTLEALEEGDLDDITPESDTVRFRGDKRRADGTYVITAVDEDDDATVTLDGVPDLADDDRTWRVAPTGHLRIDDGDGTVDVTISLESAPGSTAPTTWDDYVLRTNVRFTDAAEGVAGAVVRYDPDAGTGYRFEIDADDDEYRLIRIDADASETLKTEPSPSIEAGMDADIRMQVIGGTIDVFVDDEPTMSVIEAEPLPAGTVGIHAMDVPRIDVAEVFVEDFRTGGASPVAYRFPFTTSRFSNFVHQLHSFPDTAWTADGGALAAMLDGDDDVPDVTAAATSLPADDPEPPGGMEARAYDAVEEALAPGVTPPVDGLDATWLTADDGPVGLLVRSPEPIDWDRTTGELGCAAEPLSAPQPPEVTKVTEVRFEGENDGGTGSTDGSVEVLLDRRITPEGYVLERRLPGGRGFAPDPMGDGFEERFPETFEGDVYRQIPGPEPGELPDIPFPQDLIEWDGDEPLVPGREDPILEEEESEEQLTEVEPIDDDRISGLAARVSETFDRYDIDVSVSEDDPLTALEATTVDDELVADLDLSGEEYELLERQAARMADRTTIDATSGTTVRTVDGAERTVDGAERTVDLERLAAVTSEGATAGDPDAEWFIDEDGLSAETEGWTGFVRPAGTTPTVWETTVALGSSATAGLLFRVRDETHYLAAVLSTGDERVSLRRRDGDGAETVREVPLPDRDGADEADENGADEDGTRASEYTLRVRADSTTLWVSVDDVPLFGVEDTFLEGDAAGVFTDGDDATFTSLSANDDADVGRLLKDAFTADDPVDSEYVSGEETVGDWRVVDEPPYTIRHSMWRTRDGTLEQVSNLYGFVGNRYREPGTYAVTGDENWSDYRVAVRLRSEDDDAIGVIVRYRGDGEYYRFSMDHERKYRRLVRRSGGTTTVLWEDDERYELGREYLLTIDCVGDRIVGHLDGERLFSVTDPVIDTGKIGVYCRANVGARFEDVRVTAPGGGWVPYHVFEADVAFPAGSRIRVADDPPADDALPVGVYGRERNGADAGQLPETPTDFRIRDPTGAIGHRRVFLPEEAYEPCADVPVLRNTDGTGLFLLTAGLPSDTTATRLSMTYRRALEDDVLTQHGSDEPETTGVTVRVPADGDEGE